ncbi:MAG: penicillin-insensitive murein endopeptidase, partial [Gaiellaceae bacterium]|nr:penicillin-insensitive murein endopeptidase [Gaiellaceae bacterium]
TRPGERALERPRIAWGQATSHGLPYAGSLSGGTQLPVEGPGWVTWNPNRDRMPNAPHRLYGHERVVRTLLDVLESYHAAHPDAPRVVVGDLSLREGGPMDQHRSHENGLDVDVYYPRLDRRLRPPRAPDEIDRELAQDLVDRFVAAGAELVFVGYRSGLRGPSEVVVPYPNHEDHLHVRFPNPG